MYDVVMYTDITIMAAAGTALTTDSIFRDSNFRLYAFCDRWFTQHYVRTCVCACMHSCSCDFQGFTMQYSVTIHMHEYPLTYIMEMSGLWIIYLVLIK